LIICVLLLAWHVCVKKARTSQNTTKLASDVMNFGSKVFGKEEETCVHCGKLIKWFIEIAAGY